VQLALPTHAAATIAVEFAASHAPLAKGPGHEPVGVPNEAKLTPVKRPVAHENVAGAFSGASETHVPRPLADDAQDSENSPLMLE
jgi:hypothetical protein